VPKYLKIDEDQEIRPKHHGMAKECANRNVDHSNSRQITCKLPKLEWKHNGRSEAEMVCHDFYYNSTKCKIPLLYVLF
jgi:hypothetical protein